MKHLEIVYHVTMFTWVIPVVGIVLLIKFILAPNLYNSDPGLFWVTGTIIIFFRIQWLKEKSLKHR